MSTNVQVQSPTAAASLSREDVENIVRRSYQYVAMFNVNQKFALDPDSGGMFMSGFNKPVAMTVLADATVKSIARPNNDTLYQGAVLDLRHSGDHPIPGHRFKIRIAGNIGLRPLRRDSSGN